MIKYNNNKLIKFKKWYNLEKKYFFKKKNVTQLSSY
jgi:hypothetical protein